MEMSTTMNDEGTNNTNNINETNQIKTIGFAYLQNIIQCELWWRIMESEGEKKQHGNHRRRKKKQQSLEKGR